jgi:hypothetical protein
MALLACLLGYGEVGLWLKRAAARTGSGVVLDGNPYRRWIEDYSGAEYQGAVRVGLGGRPAYNYQPVINAAANLLILCRNDRSARCCGSAVSRKTSRVARGVGAVHAFGEGILGYGARCQIMNMYVCAQIRLIPAQTRKVRYTSSKSLRPPSLE